MAVIDEFEVIAQAAAREDAILEYLDGQTRIRTVPDSDHNAILMWLTRQFMTQRADLDLNVTGQGLKVDAYRKGRARPDGVLAPVDHFAGQGEWADPHGMLAVVEVTSWDSDTNARDRVEKARAYAACDIGTYLLRRPVPQHRQARVRAHGRDSRRRDHLEHRRAQAVRPLTPLVGRAQPPSSPTSDPTRGWSATPRTRKTGEPEL
jgi:hypothetical protein